MADEHETTPRFKLVDRIHELERQLKAFNTQVDKALDHAEKVVESMKQDKSVRLTGKGNGGKRTMSPEAREKIAAAKRKYWADKKKSKKA